MTSSVLTEQKPYLRGRLHLYAAFLALAGAIWLCARATTSQALISSAIYGLSMVALFAISAIYHIPTWPAATRLWLRRLDHSAIFFLIAGSSTPVFVIGLDEPARTQALLVMWIGAGIGVLQSLFWVQAPKVLVTAFGAALGWMGAPYLFSAVHRVGPVGVIFLTVGGAVYSAGALIYALKRPNLKPGVFGYHELFHALVVVAAAFHYAAVLQLR